MVTYPMYAGINFYTGINDTVNNILIGGGGSGEGNLITVQGIPAGYNIYNFGARSVTIQGNKIGTNINGQEYGVIIVSAVFIFMPGQTATWSGERSPAKEILLHSLKIP